MRHNRYKQKRNRKLLTAAAILLLGILIFILIRLPSEDKVSETETPAPTAQATPEPSPTPTPSPKTPEEFLTAMTLEKKIMQMFFVSCDSLTGVTNTTLAGSTTKKALEANPVGGICYFAGNIESRSQLSSLLDTTSKLYSDQNGFRVFLGIDEEGGSVARVAGSSIQVPTVPDMAQIGAGLDYDAAYSAGNTIGKYLSQLGFNLDFAPVADVVADPSSSAMAKRSFGGNAEDVSTMAASFADGLAANDIIPVYKHFPGIGSVSDDTHNGAAAISKSLKDMEDTDLLPFKYAILNGAAMIMVSHISAPALTGSDTPCSLSKQAVTDTLRTNLDFDGIIITDALDMKAITDRYTPEEAAIAAVEAGCDMLLMPADYQRALNAVIDAVNSGRISAERIDESVLRILNLKLSL